MINRLEDLALRQIGSLSESIGTSILRLSPPITEEGAKKKEDFYAMHSKCSDIQSWVDAIIENQKNQPR